MSSYDIFARFYDSLTENADYKVRSAYISDFFSEYGKGKGKVLDLACGTGTISKFLSDEDYDVTGMDISEDMLSVAENKCRGKVKFFKGDMKNFSLPYKFDFCLCSLDSVNHLDDMEQVEACFSCVRDALNEDGIFVFDVNTLYKHKHVLGNHTFAFDEEDFFLCWDNEYEGDGKVRILLDFFIFNGKNYDRFSEEFYEKAYEVEELKQSLSGFEILEVYDELSKNPPKTESERIYFVCKRK